jgi:hypothetical protein
MGIKDSEALPPGIKPESEQAYEIRTQRAEWKRGMSFLAEAQTIEEEQRVRGLFEESPYKIRQWKSGDAAIREDAGVIPTPTDIPGKIKTVEVTA